MNFFNLIGRLFGFSKQSSDFNKYNHRLKECQNVHGMEKGREEHKRINSDYDVKKKFPEREKSPLIYDKNCGKSYAEWREEAFGRYSALEKIDKENNKRANKEYWDIEKLVVLDKEARNSDLEHSLRQVKRLDKQLKKTNEQKLDLFDSEFNYDINELKERYQDRVNITKNYFNHKLFNGTIEYSILKREEKPDVQDIIRNYFESRLKY